MAMLGEEVSFYAEIEVSWDSPSSPWTPLLIVLVFISCPAGFVPTALTPNQHELEFGDRVPAVEFLFVAPAFPVSPQTPRHGLHCGQLLLRAFGIFCSFILHVKSNPFCLERSSAATGLRRRNISQGGRVAVHESLNL